MRSLKILVTGTNGMVGSALTRLCHKMGDQITTFTHASLDISDDEAVNAAIKTVRPQAVINCAAWTDVDACESDRTRAYGANATGPRNLARACRRHGAALVTISTDYVFDGTKEGFYTQRDDPNPQSVYAVSKLEGERLALSECARTMIARTGWIFGVGGKNFLSRVVELATAGHKIKAITDCFG
ncbi:MAG: SDR family oxidoreductase, partial [Pyrinomonadaceae bacterium]